MAAVLAAGIVCAGDAFACPSCTTAKTGAGYLLATAVLLAIPFGALAGFTLWIRRNARAQAETDSPGESSTKTP